MDRGVAKFEGLGEVGGEVGLNGAIRVGLKGVDVFGLKGVEVLGLKGVEGVFGDMGVETGVDMGVVTGVAERGGKWSLCSCSAVLVLSSFATCAIATASFKSSGCVISCNCQHIH